MSRQLRPRQAAVNYAVMHEGAIASAEEVSLLEDGLRYVSSPSHRDELPPEPTVEELRRSVEAAKQERDRRAQEHEILRLKHELEALTLQNEAPRRQPSLRESEGAKHRSPITSRDLQSLPGLRDQTDRQLARLGVLSDSGSTSDEDDAPRPQRRERNKRGKQKSGKSAKLTSSVVHRQLWPHSQLSLSYVSKSIPYDELSMAEFAAGYSTILSLPSIGASEKAARIEHFTSLMYLATSYPWPSVRSLHAAVLFEVECGRLAWGDSFYHLESRILHRPTSSSASAASKPSSVFFCGPYQRGKCQQSGAHFGFVGGTQKKWVQHICARCWLRSKNKEAHPESSPECPLSSSTATAKSSSAVTGGSS